MMDQHKTGNLIQLATLVTLLAGIVLVFIKLQHNRISTQSIPVSDGYAMAHD